jgi:hypothetical protein
MLNFVYLRSSRFHFLHFCLDSCIFNKVEKFEHGLACCMHLEGFQVVSGYFWACAVPRLSSAWPVSSTGLTGVSSQVLGDLVHQSDRCSGPVWSIRARLKQLLYFVKWLACIHPEGVALVQGSLHLCRDLFVVFELGIGGLCSLLKHGFVLDVSSHCPCLRGPRLVFFKWSFSLPFFGFWLLVGVSFSRFFSFLFLFGY